MSDFTPVCTQTETAIVASVEKEMGLAITQQVMLDIWDIEAARNKPMAELVSACIAAAAGDSENTQKAYSTAIGLFLQYLGVDLVQFGKPPEILPLAEAGKNGKKTVWIFRGDSHPLGEIGAGTIDRFILWRKAEGDSLKTQALRRGAVRTFLAVAYREGVLTDRQATRMGLKSYEKRERNHDQPVGRRLKPEEVRALRETVLLKAHRDSKAERDRALLDLALFAGLRRDEIAHLVTGNVKADGGRFWLVLTGKGGKTRRVKIHDTLYKSLSAWCTRSGLTMGDGDIPLFCNLTKGGQPTGKQLNASVIGRIVAEYGHLAGLAPLTGENCLSPHDLRRTAARNAYDNGATLPQVQSMLGHSDVKTTMRYIGSLEDDDNTAVDRICYTR